MQFFFHLTCFVKARRELSPNFTMGTKTKIVSDLTPNSEIALYYLASHAQSSVWINETTPFSCTAVSLWRGPRHELLNNSFWVGRFVSSSDQKSESQSWRRFLSTVPAWRMRWVDKCVRYHAKGPWVWFFDWLSLTSFHKQHHPPIMIVVGVTNIVKIFSSSFWFY